MKVIQFIVDESGEKTAVVIDLKQWGQLWEKFSNLLLTHSYPNEEWLHQSPLKEKLDRALEWNANHSPQVSDLEKLEAKVNLYEENIT
ncbi:MAG: hypothetical protein DSM107014_14190 [Gomphosphaeria aponina SAG 52.96 = DSM 107014]|uniref:Uncharacterized protein n=1 Tax=Gomphosphaeria aponina SAG 52.96 = DSM 107014 TaxID=1521640 RepID=A0A941GXI3_9CHRO|nr:hypothetical protein [Gomphosphaeria aponina SAG 52.96 = DSM 107014]